MPLAQAAGIENTLERFTAGENSRSSQRMAIGNHDDVSNALRAKLRRDCGGLRKVARRFRFARSALARAACRLFGRSHG